MFDNKLRLINNFAPAKGIVSFMEIDNNVDSKDGQTNYISNYMCLPFELLLPKMWPKPKGERDLQLEYIDDNNDKQIPQPCLKCQWINIK